MWVEEQGTGPRTYLTLLPPPSPPTTLLQDSTIEIVEHREENSGLPQVRSGATPVLLKCCV